MPFNYEKPLTQWGDPGSEPPVEMRTWLAGQKPPAGWFNWMWDACYKCFKNIQDAFNKQTVNISDNVPVGEAELMAIVNGLANRIVAITGAETIQDDPIASLIALKNQLDSINAYDPLGVPKPYFGIALPYRHLWADGKTIGDQFSNATARANDDTWSLFAVLWDAPGLLIYESNGNLSARGETALADWNAHKRLALPKLNGRGLIGLDNLGGTSANVVTNPNADILAGTGGAETVALTVEQMPNHNHGGNTGNQSQNHTHTATAGTQSTNHTHSGTTGIQSANHTHSYIGGQADENNHTGGYGGDNHITRTTGVNSTNHTHSFTTGAESQSHTHTITVGVNSSDHYHSISSQGGGQAHNNMSPWISCNWILRY